MLTTISSKTFAGGSGQSSRGLFTPRAVISATALYLAMGGAVTTYAQEGKSAVLEEIIVTATRREEGLQSIPASISAVTAEDMDKKGISGFQQLSESIPGLQMSKPTNSISTGIYLRGVGTGGTSPTDSSVGLLVDNVYQLRQGAVFSELLDIERVEVLRGPQGTLFGKNTTAGVIRIFTADPNTTEFSGRVQAVGGNLNTRELRGLVNVPLIKDTLALRASAYTAKRDGHTDNLFVGEDTRNVDRQGWRAKLLWNVTDSFQIKLTGEQGEQTSDIDAAMPAYSASMLAANPSLANFPISLGKSQHSHEETNDDVEHYGVNLKWEIANHTLTTTSSWDDIELFQLQDRDRTVLNQQVLTNLGNTDAETHEIQWNSNFDGMFNYVLGYYNQKEELSSLTRVFVGISTDSYRTTTPAVTSLTLKDQSSEAYFGTVFLKFSDQWGASLGARYTEDVKDQRLPTDLWPGGKTTFDEWTYSAKLTYQMDPDVMFYLAYDKGFKSGGINRSSNGACGLGVITNCSPLWEPETSFNHEIGIKSEWLDNRLRLNGALYYQTYEDFQVTQNVVAFQTVHVRNAAEVESKGIEGDFVFLATDNLIFNGGAALNFAEYKDFRNSSCLNGTPGCVGGVKDLSGETLDHAPELTFNLGTEYRQGLNILNGAEGFARLDVVYRDDQNLYIEQYDITKQDAYYLVNARMGMEVADRWKVTVWGNNLTDEDYLADALLDTTSAQLVPGLTRTYGLTLDWYF